MVTFVKKSFFRYIHYILDRLTTRHLNVNEVVLCPWKYISVPKDLNFFFTFQIVPVFFASNCEERKHLIKASKSQASYLYDPDRHVPIRNWFAPCTSRLALEWNPRYVKETLQNCASWHVAYTDNILSPFHYSRRDYSLNLYKIEL
jgi:hypothetical protein